MLQNQEHSTGSRAGTLFGAVIFGLFVFFTLRVFGASGALWGASEVVGLRDTDDTPTQEVAIGLSTVSFIFLISQFITETPGKGHEANFMSALIHGAKNPHQALMDEFSNRHKRQALLGDKHPGPLSPAKIFVQVLGLLAGIVLVLDLEGLGSGGAFWGTSDALWLRGNATESNGTDTPLFPNNDTAWNAIAYCFFALGFLRLGAKFITPCVKPTDEPSPTRMFFNMLVDPTEGPAFKDWPQQQGWLPTTGFILGLIINFDLLVLGTGASLWGGSYVFEARNDSNEDYWRAATLSLYALAFVRFGLSFAKTEQREIRIHSQNCLSVFVRSAVNPPEAIEELVRSCHKRRKKSSSIRPVTYGTNSTAIEPAIETGPDFS